MRLKEKIKISRASHDDTITILPGNPKEGTEDIRIRVIAVPLESGETEYLATNIFDEDYTGKGYCTECVNKLVEIGFDILNLDYLYADTYKDNLGSIRVLNKVGFKRTGIHDDFIEFKLLRK